MLRTRRALALLLAGALAAAGAWFVVPNSASAHNCVHVETSVSTIVNDPSCRQEEDDPPFDHVCASNQPQVTVYVCVDLP